MWFQKFPQTNTNIRGGSGTWQARNFTGGTTYRVGRRGYMNEIINIIVDILNTPFGRFFGILICLGLPAYALLYFDGPEW